MNSRHHTAPDYTQPMADDEMEVETALVPEAHSTSDEVEMLPPDDSPHLNDLEMADRESATTPLSTPVPQIPSLGSTPLSQPSLRRTSTRRTRVDDDHDDERDRRHPSQRVGTPSHPLNSSSIPFPLSSQSIPIPTDIGPGPSSLPSFNSRPYRFFQHMTSHNHHSNDISAQSPPLNAPQRANIDVEAIPAPESVANGTTPATNPASSDSAGTAPHQTPQPGNIRHQYLGGFAITIDVNGNATTTPLPDSSNTNPAPDTANRPSAGPQNAEQNPDRAHQQPQQPPQPPPRPQQDGSPFPGVGAGAFADLLTRIGLLAALSFQNPALFEREVDDPERAKKLVEGLDDVPMGLVKRLERVGKCGNDDGGLGDGGCTICWERLLVDVDEEAAKGPKDNEVKTDDMDVSPAEISPIPDDAVLASSSLTSLPSSTSSSSTSGAEKNENSTEKKQQRVVSLPCAHVFHAACLLPWFSKPKQTTCPICRFNIDPENLTYTPGAQRRAAAEQAQTGEGARGEADEAERQEQGRAEPGAGVGGEPPVVGIDIPLIFGGNPPPVTPMRGTERNGPQPAGGASTQTTAPTDANNTATNDNNDNNAENNTNNNTGNGDRNTHEIVTIGFDMYIGRGPPPPPFRGPGVVQIPIPGAPPINNPNMPSEAPPTGNSAPPDPAPAPATNTAPGVNPGTTTGTIATDTNVPGAGTGGQSREARENANGGRGAGTTFAIPIPMNQGFGRALGDLFSRILGGPSAPGPATAPAAPGNPGVGGGAGAGADTGAGAGQNGPQAPPVFGPERPPVPLAGSMPLPANVGLGFGFGGDRGQGPPPIILPFGPPGGAGTGTGRGTAAGDPSAGAGERGQGQEQPGQGQARGDQGAHEGQPQLMFENIPFFDIISGIFVSPPGPGLSRGPTTTQGAGQPPPPRPAQPLPAQTQLRQPQEQVHQPGGLGFTWVPGSPPPRPSSHPPHQPPQPPKKWAPPPAPGLTLRQRVEKKEKEAGLRCCDVSCGVGPSDDDPWIDVPVEGMRQLIIRDAIPPLDIRGEDRMRTTDSNAGLGNVAAVVTEGKGVGCDETRQAMCPHTFHSSCLVSAERVALALRDAEVSFVGPEGGKEVEVSCPVCRGIGRVSKEEWDAGVRALS